MIAVMRHYAAPQGFFAPFAGRDRTSTGRSRLMAVASRRVVKAVFALSMLLAFVTSGEAQQRMNVEWDNTQASESRDLRQRLNQAGVVSPDILPNNEDRALILSPQSNQPRRGGRIAKGALIGGLVGGTSFALWQRIRHGQCDDTDSYIPCEAFYAMIFAYGFVPGAVIGGLVAAMRD